MKAFSISLFLLLVLAYVPVLAQSEKFDYVASYEYHFQPDSSDKTSTQTEYMNLLFNAGKSYFVSTTKFALDTFQRANPGAGLGETMSFKNTLPKNRVKFEVERSKGGEASYYYEKIFTTTFRAAFDAESLEWEMKGGKKKIGDYDCREASTELGGRTYTAWYAPSISVPEGPYKFHGLPGLILEVSDAKQQHRFLLSGLEQRSVEFPIAHRNLMDATMEEIAEVRGNQLQNVRNSGFNVSPEMMQRAKAKLAKRNNPIELAYQ
ncbi:MAG: GLPGLI family protein [Lewinella sp.]